MMFNDALSCQAVAANWWTGIRRSQASGVINGMAAAGAMIIPPIIAALLNHYGWTTTLWVCGIGLLVITALPQFFWMKDHPSDVGQAMEGGLAAKPGDTKETAGSGEINWNARDALKTPQFWVIGLCWGFCCVSYAAVMYFSVTHFIMNGMGSVQASFFISALSAVSMVLAFLIGGVVGRMGPRWGYAAACLTGGLGCILINAVTSSYVTWILPIILFSFPNAMLQTLSLTGITRFYGPKNFAKIQGWLFPVFTIMSAATSAIIGNVLAATGTLTPVFTGCGLICLVGIPLALLFLKDPKVPAKYLAEGACAGEAVQHK